MNNVEILKIRELRKEKENDENQIKELYDFLYTYKKAFKYSESIKAINRIRTYVLKKCDRSKEIDGEVENIAIKIGVNCSHQIIINGAFRYVCQICYMGFKSMEEIPQSTKYLINDFKWENRCDKTDELVLNSENEDEAIGKILDYYGNLQYSEDIEIKEINNEKRRIKKIN